MATVMKTTRDVKGVGLSIPRPDGPEKVTGKVQYVADIQPKGLLHAKLLRSPHAHARITRIDTSRAKALAGVRAVLTAADMPYLKKKAPTRAHAVLAIDRVVFAGQPSPGASTQGWVDTRREGAEVVEIAENRIKVIPVECGGGFGGKIRALCEPVTAELARVTGRPVRYVMTRREELVAGMPAPQVIIRLKSGVKRDGTLMALEGEIIIESGAFSGAVLAVGAVFLASLYKWPSFEVRGFEVLTHKPSIAAYRAPVAPHTIYAIDSHMDQIADAIGQDPVAFRLRHVQREGDPMANNQPWQSNAAYEVLERLAQHPAWKAREEWKRSAPAGRLRGTGLSLGGWLGGLQPTGATVRLNPDGSLSVLTGQVDIAGTNIALAQLAATAYGLH